MKQKREVKRSIYMTPDIAKRADELCEKMGLTFSALVTVALNEYMKQGSVMDMVEMIKLQERGKEDA